MIQKIVIIKPGKTYIYYIKTYLIIYFQLKNEQIPFIRNCFHSHDQLLNEY